MRAAILATLVLLTAACTDPAPGPPRQSTEADIAFSGPVSITLWHALSGPQQVALDALVRKFNDTNGRGITVAALYQGNYTQLYVKTLAAIQGGTPPDLGHAYESHVADYARTGMVVDLGPYRDSPRNGLSRENQDDIYRGYYEANTFPQFGNKLLSWPFTKSLAVMYVNEDVLNEIGRPVPKTWDEFETTVTAATKKDSSGKTIRYGFGFSSDAAYFDAQVVARGGSLMAADNKTVAWDGKEGLAVLQMHDRLSKDGTAYSPKGNDWQTDLATGKLALYFSSTSFLPFVKDLADRSGSKWRIANLPQADSTKAKTVQFGANVAIFKSTPNREIASWLFIKWLTDTDQSAQLAATAYFMPVRASAANTQVLNDYWVRVPQGRQSFDLVRLSSPESNVRGQQEIRDVVVFNMIADVIGGKSPPDIAIQAAATKANQILRDAQ
jgi:ABC-type glycerol-3-phosphate transport system substrate-binding protein